MDDEYKTLANATAKIQVEDLTCSSACLWCQLILLCLIRLLTDLQRPTCTTVGVSQEQSQLGRRVVIVGGVGNTCDRC
jgi:hypothetical protein